MEDAKVIIEDNEEGNKDFDIFIKKVVKEVDNNFYGKYYANSPITSGKKKM